MTNKIKKIGIDARFFGPEKNKGLGRYVQKLVQYLEKIEGDKTGWQYYIFLKKDNFDLFNSSAKNFHKVKADFDWYSFAEQIGFLKLLNKFNFDLVHFPHFNVPIFYNKKFVVTIHDLILFHYPTVKNTTLNKFYYFIKLLAYRWAIGSAIKKSSKIIAVSDFTKNDILKNFKVDNSKVKMIYEGVDFKADRLAEKNPDEILKKYAIIKPYLLYVGNAYPHKNLERLILAFEKVKKQFPDLNLVLVGKEDFFYARLKKFTAQKNIAGVIFANYVPDDELEVLFDNAEVYVFPSLYEGFGLPPLEALQFGLPVVSSNRTAMPEILGDLAWYYFNPEKVSDMAEKIILALKDKWQKGRQVDAEKVRARSLKFNWEQMARETVRVYEESLIND